MIGAGNPRSTGRREPDSKRLNAPKPLPGNSLQNRTGSRRTIRQNKHTKGNLQMKLHNLLLTSALFISAGAAFAMNGGQAKNILKELSLTAQDSYSWEAAAPVTFEQDGKTYKTYSVLNVTMVRMNGNDNKVDTGWRYSIGGYATSEDTNMLWDMTGKELLSDSIATKLDQPAYDASLYSANLTAQQVEALDFYAKNHSGFSFQVSFDKPIEAFGLIGDEQTDHIRESILNPEDANKFYTVGGTNLLYYGSTNKYPNNGALFLVSVGSKTVEVQKEVVSGKPLPAPVVTLLIALAFGAVLVAYRNRKQAKA